MVLRRADGQPPRHHDGARRAGLRGARPVGLTERPRSRAGRAEHPAGRLPARRRRDRRPLRPGLAAADHQHRSRAQPGRDRRPGPDRHRRALAPDLPGRRQRDPRRGQLPRDGERRPHPGAARAAAAGQRAAVDAARHARGRRTVRRPPCSSSPSGPGWALAIDAATWLVSAALLLGVRIPPRDHAAAAEATSFVARAEGGLGGLHRPHLALGDRARVRAAQRDPRRRLVHPRPGRREGHHRRAGLGLRALGRGHRRAGDDASS